MALTQEQVVAQFVAIENTRNRGYTFNNVNYISSHKKVFITCNIENHGDFLITPHNFKNGQGCSKCAGNTLFTQEEILSQFKSVEKHKGKGYTFNNVLYKNNRTKVLITCPVKGHGDFLITPAAFKAGSGCKKCGCLKIGNENRLEEAELLSQFIEIERVKQRGYTFNNVKYVNGNKKVLITCNVDGHGDFSITPAAFKTGQGCIKCTPQHKSISQEECLSQFEDIEKHRKHGYTFKNVRYINTHTKVLITCPIHGDFPIRPHSFKSGQGCSKCFGNLTLSQEEALIKFQKIENTRNRGYTFNNLLYKNNKEKVLITCPIHGDFPMSFHNFRQGQGCPTCGNAGGFKKDKPGIFYYVRVNKDGCEAYKPGITNHSVKKRYKKDFEFMTVLRTIEFESGQEAYDFEQSVLNDYAYAKWDNIPLLRSGNTELMKYDILGWDN